MGGTHYSTTNEKLCATIFEPRFHVGSFDRHLSVQCQDSILDVIKHNCVLFPRWAKHLRCPLILT